MTLSLTISLRKISKRYVLIPIPVLTPQQVQALKLNYGIDMETLEDMFTAKKFNWERDNSDQFNRLNAPFDIIYGQVRAYLIEENQKKAGAAGKS